jgi:hypothetical protein
LSLLSLLTYFLSDYFELLPIDILKIILHLVEDYKDLVSLEQSCKVLYLAISKNNFLWFKSYKAALTTFTNDGISVSDDEYLEFDSKGEEEEVEKQEEEDQNSSSSSSDTDSSSSHQDVVNWNEYTSTSFYFDNIEIQNTIGVNLILTGQIIVLITMYHPILESN